MKKPPILSDRMRGHARAVDKKRGHDDAEGLERAAELMKALQVLDKQGEHAESEPPVSRTTGPVEEKPAKKTKR